MRFGRFAVLVQLALVALVGSIVVSDAHAQILKWKTAPLVWAGGTSYTKNFATALADTGFVTLPDDVAWDVLRQPAGVNTGMRLTFRVASAAANADSVHYRVQPCVGGVCSFVDSKNGTKAITNVATIARGADLGLVFTGMLQINPTGITAELPDMWPTGSRLKVQGDHTTALTGLRVWITYPTRTP